MTPWLDSITPRGNRVSKSRAAFTKVDEEYLKKARPGIASATRKTRYEK